MQPMSPKIQLAIMMMQSSLGSQSIDIMDLFKCQWTLVWYSLSVTDTTPPFL
jgi:hypothetical protein